MSDNDKSNSNGRSCKPQVRDELTNKQFLRALTSLQGPINPARVEAWNELQYHDTALRTDRSKWKQSYECEQEDAHKLRNERDELRELLSIEERTHRSTIKHRDGFRQRVQEVECERNKIVDILTVRNREYYSLQSELDLVCENLRITNEANRLSDKRVQESEKECDALTETYHKLWRRWYALDDQVFELKEREDGWQPLVVYWQRQYNALCEVVREAEKLLDPDNIACGDVTERMQLSYWRKYGYRLRKALTESGGGESEEE